MKDDPREERCTTELHGGDNRPISTPRRSGIKMKKKKKTHKTAASGLSGDFVSIL